MNSVPVRCEVCGRPLKPGRFVYRERHIHGHWAPAGSSPPWSGIDNQSLGSFPVGTDCARKIDNGGKR